MPSTRFVVCIRHAIKTRHAVRLVRPQAAQRNMTVDQYYQPEEVLEELLYNCSLLRT